MTQPWNEALETGHENIDNQHQELFHLSSKLDQAIRSQNNQDIIDIVEFLEHYVQDHFKDEEDLMLNSNFNGYDEHKAEHELFKALVKELRKKLDQDIFKTHLIFKIRQFTDKLVQHIINIDSKISAIKKGAASE